MRQNLNPKLGVSQKPAVIDEDPFALLARVPDDPVFYVRLERETRVFDGYDTVIVSDLNPGSQSSSLTGATLAELIARFPFVDQLCVKDIYPGWQDDPQFEIELERRISKTREILSVALKTNDVKIKLVCERNKYDATIRLDRNG